MYITGRLLPLAMLIAILVCPSSARPLGPAGKKKPKVYAGGVAGVEALANPDASEQLRGKGGGLYIHNSGWARLDHRQREQVAKTWRRQPMAIELGFKPSPEQWANAYYPLYKQYGFEPEFIAANAFGNNNVPTTDEWMAYVKALRKAGVSSRTGIYPTFEYANFGANRDKLRENMVSDREDFQEMIREGGGIVLDTPAGYFLAREEGYQDWVIDALKWCKKNDLDTVVLFSPHTSGEEYDEDSQKFLRALRKKGVVPNHIVSENYEPNPGPTYPNVVGDEDVKHTALGVARLILEKWL